MAASTTRGKFETEQLRSNIQSQLNRLLMQLADLEKFKDEFENEEEWFEEKKETQKQLKVTIDNSKKKVEKRNVNFLFCFQNNKGQKARGSVNNPTNNKHCLFCCVQLVTISLKVHFLSNNSPVFSDKSSFFGATSTKSGAFIFLVVLYSFDVSQNLFSHSLEKIPLLFAKKKKKVHLWLKL